MDKKKNNLMISVILPVYNSEKYVKLAIESVLNQTYQNFELIIINDASTDNSWEVVKTFHDPRIILLENEVNLGTAATANRGIQVARGDFIARMDSDDISFPDRFEKQIAFFTSHPKVGILGGPFQEIAADGTKVRTPSVRLQEPYLIKFWLLIENVMNHPTIMIRKKVLDILGGYNPNLRASEDFDLWTRLAAVTEFSNLSDPLIYYRSYSENTSHILSGTLYENHIKICQREVEKLTGRKYAQEFLDGLFSGKPLSVSQARALIDFYRTCYVKFVKKESLTPQQQKRLLYTMSWRITKVIKRTEPKILLLDEKARAYIHNKDLFVTELRNFFKSK